MPGIAALIIAFVVTVVATAVQGVTGFGMAVISVPVLALIHPALAPVPQTLIGMPLVLAMAWRERGSIDRQGTWWVIAGRFPGALVGLALISMLDADALAIAIAIIVLGGVIIVWRGAVIPRNAPTCFATGVVSGTSSLVASIGGPPLALLYGSGDGPTMRSSVSSVLAVGLLVTIGVRAATGNISGAELGVSLILLPAVGLGLASSTMLVPRVDRAMLRAAILWMSAAAAAGLILKTVVT
jgi:hypothetical protein